MASHAMCTTGLSANSAPCLPACFATTLQAAGRGLVFLANVDPVDAVRALHGLDAERTLVVIVRCGCRLRVWGSGGWSASRRHTCPVPDVLTIPVSSQLAHAQLPADAHPHLPIPALHSPCPPVSSKTFTTAETMLNARTVRAWLTERLGPEAVAKHMVAVR